VNLDADAPLYATPGMYAFDDLSASGSSSSLTTESSSSSWDAQSSSPSFTDEFSSVITEDLGSMTVFDTSSSTSAEVLSASSSNSSTDVEFISPPSIFLSEILPDPVGSDDAEWIEIRTDDNEPFRLTGIAIKDVRSGRTFSVSNNSDSALPIEEKSVFVLQKSVTGITLSQQGGELQLLWNGAVIDQLSFPAVPEGISYGRESIGTPASFYCLPTPGDVPKEDDWQSALSIQSGSTQGQGSVSLNIQLLGALGSFSQTTCSVLYGDGDVSSSCNPPSHTYDAPGEYVLHAITQNYCGTTVTHTLNISVYDSSSSTSHSSSSSPSLFLTSTLSMSSSSGPLLSQRSTGVLFYQVLPNPSGKDAGREWIEIMNVTDQIMEDQVLEIGVESAKSTKKALITIPSLSPHAPYKFSPAEFGLTLGNENIALRLMSASGPIDAIAWQKTQEDHPIGHTIDTMVHGTVTKVVDGDTFDVTFTSDDIQNIPLRFTERIRLIGVNAPELTSKNTQEAYIANEAKKYLIDLIENKKIDLKFDSIVRDVYGRLLAYASLSQGTLIQEMLVRHGLAVVENRYSHSRQNAFATLQIDALSSSDTEITNEDEQIMSTDIISSSEEKSFLQSLKSILKNTSSSSKKAKIKKTTVKKFSAPKNVFGKNIATSADATALIGQVLGSTALPESWAAPSDIEKTHFPFASMIFSFGSLLSIGSALWTLGKVRNFW
jgi:endonuclease YncB( thermonuclease family)